MLVGHYTVQNYKFTDVIFIQISFVKSTIILVALHCSWQFVHSTGSKQSNIFFIKPLVVQLSKAVAALDFLEPHSNPVDLNPSQLNAISVFQLPGNSNFH